MYVSISISIFLYYYLCFYYYYYLYVSLLRSLDLFFYYYLDLYCYQHICHHHRYLGAMLSDNEHVQAKAQRLFGTTAPSQIFR